MGIHCALILALKWAPFNLGHGLRSRKKWHFEDTPWSSFHRSTLQHRQEVGDVSLSSRDTSSLYLPPPSTAAYTQPDGKPAGLRLMEITSEGMIMELPVPSPPFTLATGRLKRDQPKVRSYTVDTHVPTSWTSLPDLNIPSPGKLLKSPAAILRE